MLSDQLKNYTDINYCKILTLTGHSEKVFYMKIFLSIFFVILSLQSWTKADDIKDFEIEGISIGDSALDFFSINQIKNNSMNFFK